MHDPKRWQRVQNIFEQVLEVPKNARQDFLLEACADQSSLMSEIQSLVDAFDAAKDELEESPVMNVREAEEFDFQTPQIDGYCWFYETHRGGQGVVYRAQHVESGQVVAIKFILAGAFASVDAKRRFQREIELHRSLEHPNIVPILDSGRSHDHDYYVMEFVDGISLDRYVYENSLSQRDVLELFIPICDAVGHAHEKGIVHRDLKPSNILVPSDGVPRILDFGLAKSEGLSRDDTRVVSSTGQVMGTLAYMSPEQADGRPHDLDTRSDVYSLGVVLYELLARKLPYDLDTSLAQQLSAITQKAPDLRSLRSCNTSAGTIGIVSKALQKDPDQRYSQASELGQDIARELRGQPTQAGSPNEAQAKRKFLARAGLLAALILVVVTAVVATQWNAGPRRIMPPLEPLAPGEFYSPDDLEAQVDSVQDMIRRGDGVSSVVNQIVDRFDRLQPNQFRKLDNRDAADLKKMKTLATFLQSNHSAEDIASFRITMSRFKGRGRHDPSGPVNDVVDRTLKSLER